MTLVVISPEAEDVREHDVLAALCARGLERYHVRKPGWAAPQLRAWLEAVPAELRARLVLHDHHELAGEYGVGGVHEKDAEVGRGFGPPSHVRDGSDGGLKRRPAVSHRSRSCHTAACVRAALGTCDAVFFSPVFPSLSKPGYAPNADELEKVKALLSEQRELRTKIIALGGITAENAPTALRMGFDGVAVLGAIWQAADPVQAFVDVQSGCAAEGGRAARGPVGPMDRGRPARLPVAST